MATVTVHALEGFSEAQSAHFRRSAQFLGEAINHREFRNRVLKAPYQELLFRVDHDTVVAKTPEDVANIILHGIERDTIKDSEIDLSITRDDNIKRPTVGSTRIGNAHFRTAGWFINLATSKKDTISPARHMVHEWLHVAGFTHKKNNGRREDVPYLVGDIVRSLLKGSRSLIDAVEDSEVAEALDRSMEEVEL